MNKIKSENDPFYCNYYTLQTKRNKFREFFVKILLNMYVQNVLFFLIILIILFFKPAFYEANPSLIENTLTMVSFP